MSSQMSQPETPREFAVAVVEMLRNAGFEALWAGGCVRDALMNRLPKDYDVATTATPQQVIELFGKRKTVPVGVSFGVVMVLGPNKACGQIEVATFRTDGTYIDGRRPESVRFCSAEEDARRRDFTINGMFYDPVADQVIDYVGGQQDLAAGIVRAIGDPHARFTEDKLRMLRAVRFAATFHFQLDGQTADAIRGQHRELKQVSVERIAQELRRMLAHETRSVSFRQLAEVRLLPEVIAGCGQLTSPDHPMVQTICRVLDRLQQPDFLPSLVTILALASGTTDVAVLSSIIRCECRRLAMSNDETGAATWIAESAARCQDAAALPLHVIKPILADHRSDLLLDYLEAMSHGTNAPTDDIEFLKSYRVQTPVEELNPKPLISGADLQQLKIAPGPVFKRLLTIIRHEQLDELLADRQEALQRLNVLVQTEPSAESS
ncbi:MAG: CCA tRNA nucleotidyltransferase [Planctomycetaceae bacterium]